jgi:hypothetical protein
MSIDKVLFVSSRFGFDYEDERAALAYEMVAAAQTVSRLANLSRVVEGDGARISDTELDDLAERLHQWALTVATNLFRPALVEELAGHHQDLMRWRALKTSMAGVGPPGPPGD